MKVEMKYKKETKGTYVYESVKPDDAIPTLYIKKTHMKPEDSPEKITVTIS